MSTATYNVSVNTTDKEDKATIKWAVDRENAQRVRDNLSIAAQNANLALQDPPGTPIPTKTILPTTTVNEYKAAYEEYFLRDALKYYHNNQIAQYKEATKNDAGNKAIIEALGEATQQQKNAALAALTT